MKPDRDLESGLDEFDQVIGHDKTTPPLARLKSAGERKEMPLLNFLADAGAADLEKLRNGSGAIGPNCGVQG